MEATQIEGLKIIQLKFYHDERGFFVERFVKERFAKEGLEQDFIQDNHSFSKPGVIRGLHYQHSPSQGKLVGVIRGKIWDVAVDLRSSSSTYGKWFAVELSAENGKLLWIPRGFAHGFCVLGDEPADVFYKVDAPYSPATEGGIHYADADLNIPWPIQNPIVGKKDLLLPSFKEYSKNKIFND